MIDRLHFETKFTLTDEAGVIEGTAWPFGSPDRVDDVIEPTAFSPTGNLPMLFAHDQAEVVGVWNNIAVTDTGLQVKGRLLVDDVARAREVHALIRSGAITGLSIGFQTKVSSPRKGGGRTIKSLDLLEISIVAVPAHAGARITNFKDSSNVNETETAVDLTARIDSLETKANELDGMRTRIDALEVKANRPGGGMAKADDTRAVETKAFGAYLRYGPAAPADELKALTVSSDPQGGYLAPAEMSGEFIRDLVEFSPIRALATVRNTSAPSVSYPRRTGVTNAKWKGETQAQDGSEPAFGQTEIPVREVNTFVDISNQLLADSAGVAEAEVRLALAEDFGQKEGAAFVSGTGPLAPEGILVAAGVGYTPTGNVATLGSAPADLLVTAMYALPAAYRARGTWLMNGRTLAAIRKLKDGQGNFLWQPAYTAGQPETILGRPVVEAVDMPDIGAGATPILFGDIATAYRIVDRLALSVLVNPYILATNGITRIHATRRVGGAVVQPAALRKITCATS